MRKFQVAIIAVLSLAFTTNALQAHIGFVKQADETIATVTYTGSFGDENWTYTNVFQKPTLVTDPDNFWDWGTNSYAGTFGYPSALHFDIIAPLWKYNGGGFDVVNPNTQETINIRNIADPFVADKSVTTGDGLVTGYEVAVRSAATGHAEAQWGRHHSHYYMTLNGQGTNDPRDGVYVMQLMWSHVSDDLSVELVDPFGPVYMVFGFNATEGEIAAAISAIPEPASLALLGVGSLLMLRRRR